VGRRLLGESMYHPPTLISAVPHHPHFHYTIYAHPAIPFPPVATRVQGCTLRILCCPSSVPASIPMLWQLPLLGSLPVCPSCHQILEPQSPLPHVQRIRQVPISSSPHPLLLRVPLPLQYSHVVLAAASHRGTSGLLRVFLHLLHFDIYSLSTC